MSNNQSGNSKRRRKFRRQVEARLKEMGVTPNTASDTTPATKQEPVASQAANPKPATLPAVESSKREKLNEALSILSFAFTVASWGWSVIAPDSSAVFGSVLLWVGVIAMLAAFFRVFRMPKSLVAVLAIAVLGAFGAFDWNIVIKPQRGKAFKDMLASGYHLTDECNRPAREPMPTWLRDASNRWQAQVGQLIEQKLSPTDIQIWRGASVIGLVTDENMTAYQCSWLNEKVAALETIINSHYDPGLKHRPYEGPLYWLESVDGKVDITEALKNGGGRFTIHEKPTPNETVKVTGQISR